MFLSRLSLFSVFSSVLLFVAQEHVDLVISEIAVLKEITAAGGNGTYLPDLFTGMVSLKLGHVETHHSNLAEMADGEMLSIGSCLSNALKESKTAGAGVDLWMRRNVVLLEVCRSHPWFLRFAIQLSTEKLKQAPWGMAWRVSFGGKKIICTLSVPPPSPSS